MQASAIRGNVTPRYGFEPASMFAATRACAARTAQQTRNAPTATDIGTRPTALRLRALVAALVGRKP